VLDWRSRNRKHNNVPPATNIWVRYRQHRPGELSGRFADFTHHHDMGIGISEEEHDDILRTIRTAEEMLEKSEDEDFVEMQYESQFVD
jgi:hypothetical protein